MDKSYTVISQRQITGRLPDDTYGPMVRVTFQVTAGPVLSVDVDARAYNVDTVRTMIEERVQHAEDISAL